MKSFGLLRTNVGLTTNIKVMIGSDYSFSLDSIDSKEDLSLSKFKKVTFNKNNYYDELIPHFYKGLPIDTAFYIKNDNDSSMMFDDFSKQYDELYQYGAKNILNNKSYSEEYEYFAPLYINKKLPKSFIIFRVDGPGLGVLTKDNFKNDILNNFKFVKLFDMTKKSVLGEWLDINFVNNKFFPKTPLEMDFRNLEFSIWNGINYETGGYSSMSRFIDDIIDEEKELFELDKFIFNSYKDNKVVFPNIINFSFLFDDSPSTPNEKRKWSLNRYLGFYIDDMELVKTISPYITPKLKNDVVIKDDNILYSNTGNPFIEDWSSLKPYYIEYNGVYYKVEKITENMGISLQKTNKNGFISDEYVENIVTKYKIISDINLNGKELLINKNFGLIDIDNKLIDYNIDNIIIDDFDKADTWLIEIDGIYHNLVYDNGIKLITDYSFKFNQNDYEYKVAGDIKKISTVVDFNNSPKKFNIYKIKFSDIKDFDDRIIDTEYSKYEYEKVDEITLTDETKMYMENLSSKSDPIELDDFVYKSNVVNIPVSSEYTANYETFKIQDNDLSDIWNKNSIYCRWVYQNSLSANDYPYLLNNSNIFEDFNRTVNPFDPDPKRIERNLDYFYTINSSTSSYLHHSLHIEKLDSNGDIDSGFKFELDKYLNIATYSVGTSSNVYNFDYFTSFFDRNTFFNNSGIKKNVKKHSEFNIGDESIPNTTLFKGIEFSIYDVDSITLNNSNEISNINLKSMNTFDDYKFSILLSDNKISTDNFELSINDMDWTIIDEWVMDKNYQSGTIVIFEDILYISNTDVITTDPVILSGGNQLKACPYNLPEWDYHTFNSLSEPYIFWSPSSTSDFVYNNGEYYKLEGTDYDFWYPKTSGYNIDDNVLYKGLYYKSMTSSNYNNPDCKDYWEINEVDFQSVSIKWSPIQLWNPSISYYFSGISLLVVHDNIVWSVKIGFPVASTIPSGEIPGISEYWSRQYSLVPDTNFVYGNSENPIISMNNRYYLCNSNISNSTLENGIVIYINKKWKNILININISDNTYPNISECDRDELYTDLYKKITAHNFIESINDISNKNGFTDPVTYIIIDENNNIKKYNYTNDIVNLPYIIRCNNPDLFQTKINSLEKVVIKTPNKLKINKSLLNGDINDINKLNYFNSVPISVNIIENKFEPKVFENYHGNKNILTNAIYRYSGFYMPLFYDIQLFNKNSEYSESGNYLFDSELTEFGIMKERKMSKINRFGSILKLKDENDIKSIYPMVDEFGYTTKDFFIFSSTWDYKYHNETIISESPEIKISDPVIVSNNIGQPIMLKFKKLNF